MRQRPVAVVTGANQGLGLALVERLLIDLGADANVVLTARDRQRGLAAVAGLQRRGLTATFAQLDVSDLAGVSASLGGLVDTYGPLDIVIHNAAARLTPDRPPEHQVREFVETNNFGTTSVLRGLRGRLADGARVVVVASSFGTVESLPTHLHRLFDGDAVSLESLDQVMAAYIAAVERGAASELGWPEWVNIPSKVGQVAAMRVFAREQPPEQRILVNAACPGLIDTPASRPWFGDMSAAQTPAEAARDVVWLARLPNGSHSPHGQLVQHRRVLPFT